MHQMFSVHATPQEFKNAAITDHFGFMVEENSALQEIEITWLSWCHPFRKAPFSKCFLSTLKRKTELLLNSPDLNISVFEKLDFRDGSVWTVRRPNRRNKAAFSNFFVVVWTLPWIEQENNSNNSYLITYISLEFENKLYWGYWWTDHWNQCVTRSNSCLTCDQAGFLFVLSLK